MQDVSKMFVRNFNVYHIDHFERKSAMYLVSIYISKVSLNQSLLYVTKRDIEIPLPLLQLHLDEGTEAAAEETNDLDFFKQHENLEPHRNEATILMEEKAYLISNTMPSNDCAEKSAPETASNCLGPSVKLFESTSSIQAERKPTIGCRTAQSKRPGGVSLHIFNCKHVN